MGIPAGETGQFSAPPTEAPDRPRPSSTSNLPPEAIALASRLFDLARNGDTAALTQYLDAGIPPNLTNHAGDTLLMLAAYHGHVDTTRALLDRGAEANVVNDRGQSILAGAVFKGWDEVVRALVEKGADGELGQPSARQCARMFRRNELFGVLGVDGHDDAPLPGFVGGPPGGLDGETMR